MSAETDLNAALLAATSITDIVAARIYPSVVPDEQPPPSIAYERTATEYVNTIHGTALGEYADLDVWCMAQSLNGAHLIADAVEPVVRAAGFVTLGRRTETDDNAPGAGLWAAVLSIRRFDS